VNEELPRVASIEPGDTEERALYWARELLRANSTQSGAKGVNQFQLWNLLVEHHTYHFITSGGKRVPGLPDDGGEGAEFASRILDRAVEQKIALKTADGMWEWTGQ
jgi:hypothetical protein